MTLNRSSLSVQCANFAWRCGEGVRGKQPKPRSMFKIVRRIDLAPNIVRMDLAARRVAESAQPGQFVIVRVDDRGERIPLTIADYDEELGTVSIVTQTIGVSTKKLCALQEGDSVMDFVGPLGCGALRCGAGEEKGDICRGRGRRGTRLSTGEVFGEAGF